jgi:hypothetical protein
VTDNNDGFEVLDAAQVRAALEEVRAALRTGPPRKTAAQVDERVDRLQTWVAEQHKRLNAIEEILNEHTRILAEIQASLRQLAS